MVCGGKITAKSFFFCNSFKITKVSKILSEDAVRQYNFISYLINDDTDEEVHEGVALTVYWSTEYSANLGTMLES